MVKKIKSPSCGPSWCQNHVFQLIPLKSHLYFNKKIKLRLCPKHNKTYNIFDNVLPVLNVDKKHYTPLFILEEQRKFYLEHDQRAQGNHQKLVERDQQDESYFTMYQPKHGGEKPYCLVCEKSYSDYYEHINSHDHKRNLQSSIFTRYLMQIQQNLKKQQITSTNIGTPFKQNFTSKQDSSEINNGGVSQNGQKLTNFQRKLQMKILQRPTMSSDNLEMQHIESHYVDISNLKETDEFI